MSEIERMKEILACWGLIPQVFELYNAGFTMQQAIKCVYIAHARKG